MASKEALVSFVLSPALLQSFYQPDKSLVNVRTISLSNFWPPVSPPLRFKFSEACASEIVKNHFNEISLEPSKGIYFFCFTSALLVFFETRDRLLAVKASFMWLGLSFPINRNDTSKRALEK